MFVKKQIKYSLIALMGMTFIGCTSPQKSITIQSPKAQHPIVGGARHVRQAPIVQEEIVTYPVQDRITVIDTPVEVVHQQEPIREIERVVPQKEPKVIAHYEEPKVLVHQEEPRPKPKPKPKVIVPRNHPSLGIKQGVSETSSPINSTIQNVDRLNGETMARMPFPLDEYRNLKKIGRSTVSGRVAIINTMNEKEILGKNLKLYLNPVTSYSTQWYNESYLGGYKMSKVDRKLYNYLKFSTSNGNGKFDFFGIPKGKYYLIGSMMCGEECGLSSTEKIRLVKEIYVGSGVTRVDLIKRVP